MDSVINALISDPQTYFMSDAMPIVLHIERRSFTYSDMAIVTFKIGNEEKKFFIKNPTTGGHQVKVERLTKEFHILMTLFNHFKDHEHFGVPRVVGLFNDQESIITEECPGVPLAPLMSNSARHLTANFARLENACSLAGQWLRMFHDVTRHREAVLDPQNLVDYCKIRLDYLVRQPLSGVGQESASKIISTISRLVGETQLDDLIIAGCHNDYSSNNIFIDDERIYVIDFTMYDYQPIYYDIYSFWTNLQLMKIDWQFSRRRLAKLQEIFLSSYGIDLEYETPIMTAIRYRNMLTKLTNFFQPTHGLYRGIVQKRMYRYCFDWIMSHAGLGGGIRMEISR